MKNTIRIKKIKQTVYPKSQGTNNFTGATGNTESIIEQTLTDFAVPFDFDETTTISELKSFCKNKLGFFDHLEITKEIIWLKNSELKDSDLVTGKSGYEYNVYVK